MRIDVHAHIGSLPERPDATPEELDAYRDMCRLDRLAISNLDAAATGNDVDEADANYAVLQRCQADKRLIPLYWVRPGRSDSHPYAMAGAIETDGFAGAVFAPVLNGFSAEDRVVEPYLNALEKLGRPAFFLTAREEPARPHAVYVAARRHPTIPFVMCNASTDTHWHEALELMRRIRQQKDAQLYVTTSQAGAEDVRATISAIGAEHLLLGTDALRFGPQHAARVGRLLNGLEQTISPDAYERVTFGNARRVLHLLGLPEAARPAAVS